MRKFEEFYKAFDKPQTFNDKQLSKQTNMLTTFLEKIYPSLKEDQYNDGCIELRFLRRLMYPGAPYVKSYNTWRLEPKDIEKLAEKLAQINGEEFCSYYSGYTFDYHKDTYDGKNKKRKKGKINNDNALTTQILPMDFDDISYEEFLQEKQRLLDLGIHTLDIFTGHGYQSIILLKEKNSDKQLFDKFTSLMIEKGFKVDSSLVDAARVLRLPYTFNNKSYDEKNKKYNPYNKQSIATTIIHDTDERYDVREVFKRLGQLPSQVVIVEDDSDLPFQDDEQTTIDNVEVVQSTETSFRKEVNVEQGNLLYGQYLAFDRLEKPIQKMLLETPSGVRNAAMLFLLPFFKNTLGMSVETITEVMIVWGKQCTPAYDEKFIKSEVARLQIYKMNATYGRYSPELAKVFGYINFDTFKKDNELVIENEVFDKLATLKDTSFKIYLSLKLEKKLSPEKQAWTIDEMVDVLKLSTRTVKTYLKDLVEHELLIKIKGNSRAKIKDMYYLNPYLTKSKGYTKFNTADIDVMLIKLTDGEMKLYSYISYIIGDGSRTCFMSQKNIAANIGKKQNSVSEMTDSLVDKRFISKNTYKQGYMMHCEYVLKY